MSHPISLNPLNHFWKKVNLTLKGIQKDRVTHIQVCPLNKSLPKNDKIGPKRKKKLNRNFSGPPLTLSVAKYQFSRIYNSISKP